MEVRVEIERQPSAYHRNRAMSRATWLQAAGQRNGNATGVGIVANETSAQVASLNGLN